MNYRILLSLVWLMTGYVSVTLAQGKLLYLNGKEKRFITAEVKGESIVYKPEGASGEVYRHADKYNVFAIVRDDGTEQVIYEPDTVNTDDPPVAEIRDYIKGEQHAVSIYKKPMNLAGGIISGAAGSLIGFYGLPIPLVYTTIVGRVTPKLPANERQNNYSEAFIAGYEKKSRNIKVKNSMIGGGIGFALGISALILILGND